MNKVSQMSLMLVVLMVCAGAAAWQAQTFRAARPLRVASFNTWWFGQNVYQGFDKVVKQIHDMNADIVLMQVSFSEYIWPVTPTLDKFMAKLGRGWQAALGGGKPLVLNDVDDDTFKRHIILTKHKLLDKSFVNEVPDHIGIKVQLNDDDNYPTNQPITIRVWNTHFRSQNMGNDILCLLKSVSVEERFRRVNIGEQVRIREATTLLKKVAEYADIDSDNEITIIGGDLNSASHLDWTPANTANHCNVLSYEWPVTKLIEDAGFLDSYRVLHPDPVVKQGITWSTTEKTTPQDRIDYIYFKSQGRLIPINSMVFSGADSSKDKPQPWHYFNLWPSDHFAVITDFLVQ